MAAALIDLTRELLDFYRERSLATLAAAEQLSEASGTNVLGWRPGPGRAHIAWQLMHVGITEELFATERFLGTAPAFASLVPRFKGGSKPDDDIPTAATIREVLSAGREHLGQALAKLSPEVFDQTPTAFLKERGMTVGRALKILPWHEAHHQGQAHITLNLYKASRGG